MTEQTCGNCKWWRSVDVNFGKCRTILTPLSRLCRHDFGCNQFEAESMDVTERVCGDCKLWHTVDCAKQVKMRQQDEWITFRPAKDADGCYSFQPKSTGPFRMVVSRGAPFYIVLRSERLFTKPDAEVLCRRLNECWCSAGAECIRPSYTPCFAAVQATNAGWGVQFHDKFFYSGHLDKEQVTTFVEWLNSRPRGSPIGYFSVGYFSVEIADGSNDCGIVYYRRKSGQAMPIPAGFFDAGLAMEQASELVDWLNECWCSSCDVSSPQGIHPSHTNQFTAVHALGTDWGIQFHNRFFYSEHFDREQTTALVKWLNRLCQKYPFGCFRTEVHYSGKVSSTNWGIKFCHHVMKQTMPHYTESFEPHLSEKSVTGLVEWLNKQWKQLGEQQHVPDGKSDKPFVPERTSRGTWHVAAYFLDSSGWVAKKLRESEARRVAVWLNERWRTPGSRLSRPFVPMHIPSTKSWSVRGCFATDSGWLTKDLCECEARRMTEWLNEHWQTDR